MALHAGKRAVNNNNNNNNEPRKQTFRKAEFLATGEASCNSSHSPSTWNPWWKCLWHAESRERATATSRSHSVTPEESLIAIRDTVCARQNATVIVFSRDGKYACRGSDIAGMCRKTKPLSEEAINDILQLVTQVCIPLSWGEKINKRKSFCTGS